MVILLQAILGLHWIRGVFIESVIEFNILWRIFSINAVVLIIIATSFILFTFASVLFFNFESIRLLHQNSKFLFILGQYFIDNELFGVVVFDCLGRCIINGSPGIIFTLFRFFLGSFFAILFGPFAHFRGGKGEGQAGFLQVFCLHAASVRPRQGISCL